VTIPASWSSVPDWQRIVAGELNRFFQRVIVDYSGTPFTSAYYGNAQITVNGATPGAWYSALQGGEVATETFTAAVLVPSTATNHQTNAGSFYTQSDRAQPANGGDVAGYFQAVANANSSAVFPINAVGADTAGKTGQILGNELDFNVSANDTTVNGLNLVLVDNTGGSLTGTRNAFRAGKAFGTNGWSNGLVTEDGGIDTYAAFIGSQTSTASTNRESQKLALVSYKSDNTRCISTIGSDHLGTIWLRPGSTGGAIAFQNSAGSTNLAYVDSGGLTINPVTVASLPAAGTVGRRSFVTDANATTFASVVASGGANKVPVYDDGTNWRIG
jgi:hypothetical protein